MIDIVDGSGDVNDSKILSKNFRNSRNLRMLVCPYLDPFLSILSMCVEGKENKGCHAGGNGKVVVGRSQQISN